MLIMFDFVPYYFILLPQYTEQFHLGYYAFSDS
jgi:hypothetical protein